MFCFYLQVLCAWSPWLHYLSAPGFCPMSAKCCDEGQKLLQFFATDAFWPVCFELEETRATFFCHCRNRNVWPIRCPTDTTYGYVYANGPQRCNPGCHPVMGKTQPQKSVSGGGAGWRWWGHRQSSDPSCKSPGLKPHHPASCLVFTCC